MSYSRVIDPASLSASLVSLARVSPGSFIELKGSSDVVETRGDFDGN